MLRLVVPALVALGACAAPPATVAPSPDHPAHAEAAATPHAERALPGTLATAAPAPTPPEMAGGAMDHAAMDHGEMDHAAMGHAGASADTLAALSPEGEAALGRALDAYLTIQQQLAADATEGVADAARDLDAAVAALTATAVAGDEHFWHARAATTDEIRARARAMAAAPDIAGVREGFGHLNPALVTLLGETGVPADADLHRFVCGMADAPQRGVWLQHGIVTRNPYFGASMLMCGRRHEATPTRGAATGEATAPANGHAGH